MRRILTSEAISGRPTVLRFAKGQIVYHGGEAGERCFLIRHGRASVTLQAGPGDPVMLNILGPSDIFGELALLRQDHTRSATVQALEQLETVTIGRADFDRARHADPAMNELLLEALADRIGELSTRLAELSSVPARQLVHRCLLRMGDTFGVRGVERAVIPLTQPQLASIAGVGLRMTHKVLAEARNQGTITTGTGFVRVDDWDRVCRVAGVAL